MSATECNACDTEQALTYRFQTAGALGRSAGELAPDPPRPPAKRSRRIPGTSAIAGRLGGRRSTISPTGTRPGQNHVGKSRVIEAAPRITRIDELALSRLFSLQQIDVQFGNGSIRTFERWKERWPHSVIMVAVTEAQEVLLVSEFVAGLGRRVLRLPSGRVEDGESPASAARRELCEEVGFDSGRHRIIHRFYNEPGHSDAFTDVALLTDLRPGHLTGDEPEALTQVAWPLQEIRALIEQSVVSDVRTIAALFLAEVVLRGSA